MPDDDDEPLVTAEALCGAGLGYRSDRWDFPELRRWRRPRKSRRLEATSKRAAESNLFELEAERLRKLKRGTA